MQATAELKRLSKLSPEERASAQDFPLRFRNPTVPLLEGDFRFTGNFFLENSGGSLLEICRQDKSRLERLSRGGKTVMRVSPDIVSVDFAAKCFFID